MAEMDTVSYLTINTETREIVDAKSRRDIAALQLSLDNEISNRTDAVTSVINLINQSGSEGSSILIPSFSIDENGHLIAEFDD